MLSSNRQPFYLNDLHDLNVDELIEMLNFYVVPRSY